MVTSIVAVIFGANQFLVRPCKVRHWPLIMPLCLIWAVMGSDLVGVALAIITGLLMWLLMFIHVYPARRLKYAAIRRIMQG